MNSVDITLLDQLRVGGLLYAPSLHRGLAEKISCGAIPGLTSIALCLEDSVQNSALAAAEEQLREILCSLWDNGTNGTRVYIRIRNAAHLLHVHEFLGGAEDVVSGYILPKFDMTNAEDFLKAMQRVHADSGRKLAAMPILESERIADQRSRINELYAVKACLDDARDMILNVRVGGNDFSNLYGLRRSKEQTIYDLGIIRDILLSIANCFSREYIVSGPVWEYFGTDPAGSWAEGLRRELRLDRANGFIGKTSIHPSQLPLIRESLMVSREDLQDAQAILSWQDPDFAVSKGWSGDRMNEVKCHTKWAERICLLAEIYGVSEDTHGQVMV